MGDFNCVEDPLLDVKHAEGAGTVYANAHAALLMQIMARAGLGDVYRKLHGRTAAGFTRECESVRTRIDRIYAKEFSSDTVWHSHELDQKHAKSVRTDHTAVVAEMAPLGASKSHPAASRINKEILKEEEMYERIQDIWHNIEGKYKRVSPNPARVKWEEFKAQAYATLMAETKKRRKETRMASKNEAILEYEGLLSYLHDSRAPPSGERVEIAQKLREGLLSLIHISEPTRPY